MHVGITFRLHKIQLRLMSILKPTARVFPDPVLAIPTMFSPLIAIGQPCAWMAVGKSKPCFLKHIVTHY